MIKYINKSEDYSALKKTISVNITDYDMIPQNKKLHSSFKILEKDKYFPLTEDLQIHFLELPKLK
ncbi:PD-(D/E)XK nuclease family transposase [Sporanaerobacter sp. PP17-6a]|uniref:PD-(D/E)XK nuclease family transposase n=1 Tax=Sporanaerobacter sp. PP17-6a TaxID=1891289 RepID=UPI00115FE0B9|nr:PD-(D/E)XK nuclease family transposase [Sporanaerobacter sp. PP17-6a]